MRLASIVPGAFAEHVLTEEDDYHLLIAPEVIDNQPYREFYRGRGTSGDFIILDNGAYEVHAYEEEVDLSPTALEAAVDALGFLPSEIVLPDVPGSAHETLLRSTKAAYYLRERWRYSVFMVVPHGTTLEEYLACAQYMVELPGLQSFGVSFIAADAIGISREELVKRLLESIRKIDPDIHLLGYRDPVPPETKDVCRGIDTAKHVRMAIEGFFLDKADPVIKCGPRPSDFFRNDNLNPELMDAVAQNITIFREHLA